MAYKKIDLRLVFEAILPALAVSVAVVLVGKALDLPDSTVDRVSQILFFPIFLVTYNVKRSRSSSDKAA